MSILFSAHSPFWHLLKWHLSRTLVCTRSAWPDSQMKLERKVFISLMRQVLLLSPFYRCNYWGITRLISLIETMQPVNGRVKFWMQVMGPQSLWGCGCGCGCVCVCVCVSVSERERERERKRMCLSRLIAILRKRLIWYNLLHQSWRSIFHVLWFSSIFNCVGPLSIPLFWFWFSSIPVHAVDSFIFLLCMPKSGWFGFSSLHLKIMIDKKYYRDYEK